MELSIILILELFSYLEDLLEMFPALGSGGLSPVMELQGKTAGHLQNTTTQIKPSRTPSASTSSGPSQM